MKYNIFLSFVAVIVVLGSFSAQSAYALSCLSTDMYLKSVVNDEDTLLFVGTSVDRMEGEGYTAEVLKVSEVKQGYVEEKVFVYHQNDETWGYLCNAGPKEKGSTGVYVATRDGLGKYNVSQRLEMNDPLVKILDEDLKKAEVVGTVAELSSTDRKNQIMTTISDLIREIGILLQEYMYWK